MNKPSTNEWLEGTVGLSFERFKRRGYHNYLFEAEGPNGEILSIYVDTTNVRYENDDNRHGIQ